MLNLMEWTGFFTYLVATNKGESANRATLHCTYSPWNLGINSIHSIHTHGTSREIFLALLKLIVIWTIIIEYKDKYTLKNKTEDNYCNQFKKENELPIFCQIIFCGYIMTFQR